MGVQTPDPPPVMGVQTPDPPPVMGACIPGLPPVMGVQTPDPPPVMGVQTPGLPPVMGVQAPGPPPVMGACIDLVCLHVLVSDSGCDILAPNSANVPVLAPDPSNFFVLFFNSQEDPVLVSGEASAHFPRVWTKKDGGPFDPGIARRSILKGGVMSGSARDLNSGGAVLLIVALTS
ncbi:unnamed protein product [Protopolystoma xenopodis]|uniref:Uncharacterized protein n=1 Tax=Protopolystoma xenopodis TaxID=117903 RepID=A0A448XSK7_9PLAT|nr:unnamed protein product [Protopolystoma xenopodis]